MDYTNPDSAGWKFFAICKIYSAYSSNTDGHPYVSAANKAATYFIMWLDFKLIAEYLRPLLVSMYYSPHGYERWMNRHMALVAVAVFAVVGLVLSFTVFAFFRWLEYALGISAEKQMQTRKSDTQKVEMGKSQTQKVDPVIRTRRNSI